MGAKAAEAKTRVWSLSHPGSKEEHPGKGAAAKEGTVGGHPVAQERLPTLRPPRGGFRVLPWEVPPADYHGRG